MTIHVIYGTETGNAEMVADDLMEALENDATVSAQDMVDFDLAEVVDDDFVILVSSTYGEGELPNSAQPFFDRLEQEAPDLSGLAFATFGLGDSFYDTFNQGSQTLADKLLELGATELGERGIHDASKGELPGDVAVAWLKALLSVHGSRIMAGEGAAEAAS
ncbi:flavodoxin domain-containing protein [Halomonas sp. LR5S13]|uniref:flavodoxin domain-containing protein n=1 Tax=Halomonas rhizosphaerae TaxID=3043296 RepID=UPI0024A85A4E|nr:flavodoxin domain-containing protein [Halomonas rhizosphaerae]MDI5922863.1 flavodoxin domain-containing protein [Halomonas rhizosphaerae]